MKAQTAGAETGGPPGEENWLFYRLPAPIAEMLTDEQRQAIHRIATTASLSRPPVSIRFSFPLAKWRLYLAITAGPERRTAGRRARERAHHPLHTLGNFLFALGLVTLFFLAVLFALALYAALSGY